MSKDTKKFPAGFKPVTPAEIAEIQQKTFNSMSDAQKKHVGDSTWCYGTFASAWGGKSRADAIKAKCIDCCCWQRDEITNCPVEVCPLWKYRPYRPKK